MTKLIFAVSLGGKLGAVPHTGKSNKAECKLHSHERKISSAEEEVKVACLTVSERDDTFKSSTVVILHIYHNYRKETWNEYGHLN